MRVAVEQASKRLRYHLLSQLIHQPALLRAIARLLRRRPGFARIARVVADRDSAIAVFHRHWSFTTTQAPNLRAGEFVIGMEAGKTQLEDRKFLESALLSPAEFGEAAATASRSIVQGFLDTGRDRFDLIDDYLAPVAWAPLAAVLGPAAAEAIVNADEGKGTFYEELRAVGAQLIVGPISPRGVLEQAEKAGAALNRRVESAEHLLDARWSTPANGGANARRRNAVGLMWVGHPATVQAGALCVQELLARPQTLRELATKVGQHRDTPRNDQALRAELAVHVRELLRLRPPFPILARNVPRDTWFSLASDVPPGDAPAGSGMTILVVGALADAAGTNGGRYCPGHVEAPYNMMMFGHGARACIAGEHVVEVLAGALAGLLRLPGLRWARPLRRIAYCGPTIVRMPLRYRA